MIKHSLLSALLVTAGSLVVVAPASAQATRTWVSGVGDDVNPCSRPAPCKTFAGAISKTAAGGEINAIDPGGFGGVTITKAMTIDVRGFTGGVLNTGTSGVIINAGPTDSVVLRGLEIYGGSGANCGYGGLSGVRILQAGNVRIEDTTIARQNKAIDVATGATPVNVLVNRAELSDNCANGVVTTGSANLTLRDSTIAHSGTAVSVADGGTAWLTGNLLFANALGLQATGTGAINDYGDNRYVANTDDGKPTKDLTPVAPTGPAGPTGTTGATGAAGATGAQGEAAITFLLARSKVALTARAGRTVLFKYGATLPATSTVSISRSGKTLRTMNEATRAGTNAVRLVTKGLAAGKYTLTLHATSADGQTATTEATVRLRKAR